MTPNAYRIGVLYLTIREHTSAVPRYRLPSPRWDFLLMANYVPKQNRENLIHSSRCSQGLLFLLLTVPVLFSGHWITVFWAIRRCCYGRFLQLRIAGYTAALPANDLTVGKFVLHHDEILPFACRTCISLGVSPGCCSNAGSPVRSCSASSFAPRKC